MASAKKKLILTCVLMIITVVSFVYSTLAYFSDFATARQNKIASGEASVQILDVTYPFGSSTAVSPDEPIKILPGYEIRKTVSARNDGAMPIFIRMKLNSQITLAEHARGREAEIDTSLVGYNIDTEHWTLHTDGYYYYNAALDKGQEASPLFTKVIFSDRMGNLYKDSTIQFTVYIQVVQASGNSSSPFDTQIWSDPLREGGTA